MCNFARTETLKIRPLTMPLLPILLLLLIIVPDVYIWWGYVRGNALPVWSVLYWVPLALTMCGVVCFMLGHADHWVLKATFLLFLCCCLPKILFLLFSLIGRLLGTIHPMCATVGNWVGVVTGVLMFSIALYGFIWGWKRLEVHPERVSVRHLPAKFEGYRIVQISDLHLGTFGADTTYIQKMVRQVNALQPDLVVFTGDLVNTSPDELTPFKDLLSRLSATDGVLSIMGNHDYTTYHPEKDSLSRIMRIRKLIHDVEAMGWQWLKNASHVVCRGADSLFIVGVENVARPPFPSHGDLKAAMQNVPQDAAVVLLSHDPTHWRREVLPHYPNIGLTLSGHTHAMQFKLFGHSPSQWIYDEWGGHYHEGEQHLIVSTGTGSNIPFRFGAWPEVVLVELHGCGD